MYTPGTVTSVFNEQCKKKKMSGEIEKGLPLYSMADLSNVLLFFDS